MNKKDCLSVFAALAFLGGITSANAADTDLVGAYAVKEKGQLKEFLKISQENGKFILAEKKKDGSWKPYKEPLATIQREQFEKLLKHPYSSSFDGLGNKGVAIFKVPKKFHEGKFKAETGYFMVFAFGPVELYKL